MNLSVIYERITSRNLHSVTIRCQTMISTYGIRVRRYTKRSLNLKISSISANVFLITKSIHSQVSYLNGIAIGFTINFIYTTSQCIVSSDINQFAYQNSCIGGFYSRNCFGFTFSQLLRKSYIKLSTSATVRTRLLINKISRANVNITNTIFDRISDGEFS